MRGCTIKRAWLAYLSHSTLERANSPRWVRWQDLVLSGFRAWLVEHHRLVYLEQLQPHHLTSHLTELREAGDSLATMTRRATVIRAACRWAESQGLTHTCPLIRARLPRQTWLPSEIPAWPFLWSLVHMDADPDRHDAMVLLLLTGMRRGELLALRWADVDLVQGVAQVRATTAWAPKSRKPRAVPLCAEAVATLTPRKAMKNPGPFLIEGGKSRPEPCTLTHAFKRLATVAEAPTLRLHDLRHGFASHILDLGADIVAVQTILGHSSLNVTRRYLHPDKEVSRRVAALLDKDPTLAHPEAS